MLNGWKTALVAFLVVIFGGLETFTQSIDMSESARGWVTMGIGVAMFALRAVTSSPIFQKPAGTDPTPIR